MPEVIFHIRWPDGREERCYSPSTAIRQHLTAGQTYPLAEFVARARAGMPRCRANPRSTPRMRAGAAMLTATSVRSPHCNASKTLAPPMEWPITALSGGSSDAASSTALANSITCA